MTSQVLADDLKAFINALDLNRPVVSHDVGVDGSSAGDLSNLRASVAEGVGHFVHG
jgi:hypothetical protein